MFEHKITGTLIPNQKLPTGLVVVSFGVIPQLTP
jgi:hypothetical protein